MSKFLIIGNKGSMGRRYEALLRHKTLPFHGVDSETPVDAIAKLAANYDGVILATPTDTHYQFLLKLAHLDINLLCEKPITKDASELEQILELYKNKKLQMVMQYRDLDIGVQGDSFYDYYNHGRDGLYWDCMQVIGLARGRVMVSESSPFWKCRLNDVDLNLSQMDYAYSLMLNRWMRNPRGDLAFLKDIHTKVREMEQNARAKSAEALSSGHTSALY